MSRIINIGEFIGKKYGKLTIIESLGKGANGRYIVRSLCDCGKYKENLLSNVITKKTRSCGCINTEMATKHGLVWHPLYWVWVGIKSRCYDKKYPTRKNYSERGVIMCDEWKNDFVSFYNWAIQNGWKKGLKIDKDIKCPEGKIPIYSPEYCSIVTHRENMRKKITSHMIEYNGETMCLTEWAEKLGIKYGCLSARLKMNWPIEKVFSQESYRFNQNRKTA